jgi:hypothetical protein
VRTTIDIDDDLLTAVKEIAAAEGSTMGLVLSRLLRRGLEPPPRKYKIRNGVPVIPAEPGQQPLTMEMVNALRDGD